MDNIYDPPVTLRRLNTYFWWFWICLVVDGVFMAVLDDVIGEGSWPEIAMLLALKIGILVCFVGYLLNLSILLSEANRPRVWLWILLTFVFSLLGVLVSYLWIRKITKEEGWR